jgi:hypothetical protein
LAVRINGQAAAATGSSSRAGPSMDAARAGRRGPCPPKRGRHWTRASFGADRAAREGEHALATRSRKPFAATARATARRSGVSAGRGAGKGIVGGATAALMGYLATADASARLGGATVCCGVAPDGTVDACGNRSRHEAVPVGEPERPAPVARGAGGNPGCRREQLASL